MSVNGNQYLLLCDGKINWNFLWHWVISCFLFSVWTWQLLWATGSVFAWKHFYSYCEFTIDWFQWKEPFQWANPGLFIIFSINCYEGTVDFSEIQTRIFRVEGEHGDLEGRPLMPRLFSASLSMFVWSATINPPKKKYWLIQFLFSLFRKLDFSQCSSDTNFLKKKFPLVRFWNSESLLRTSE